MDTIFALSSGAVPSGVAVVRVSGPLAREIVEQFAGGLPEPRVATLRSIRDRNDRVVDRGLVIWFPGPRSFSGEDCAEFHLHGGPAVVDRLLLGLAGMNETRMAEPGEFSRRAFVHGKIDLTEAEGLADLISAETESQRVLALSQAAGSLRGKYDEWRNRLLGARAMVEAEIDFADEEDVPGSVSESIWRDLTAMADEIDSHISSAEIGSRVRRGFRVAIVGAPNVGKSSLLNSLAKSDAAIVSDMPGTTRDAIEVRLDLEGILVVLIDTAGIRDASDFVEAEGIRRTFLKAEEADLILHVSDRREWGELELSGDVPVLKVFSKDDELNGRGDEDFVPATVRRSGGLDKVVSGILGAVNVEGGKDLVGMPTRRRYLDHLRMAAEELRLAIENPEQGLEVRAECLRQASLSIGRITGQDSTEDVLGVIFSEFCIGK